jgi:hypothetical protein
VRRRGSHIIPVYVNVNVNVGTAELVILSYASWRTSHVTKLITIKLK